MNDTVVYRHRKPNGEVFYVGIGNEKRPYVKKGRSEFWFNTVKKHGYEVEVIAKGLSWEDACELEEFLIEEYGRRDLRLGTLVNMTDGGDGAKGRKNGPHSAETRKKISESNKGVKRSAETRKRMSEANTGRTHTNKTRKKIGEARKGRTHTAESRKRIKESNKGIKRSAETRKRMSEAKKLFKVTCPHCNKTGGSAMYRWHFDNCKNK